MKLKSLKLENFRQHEDTFIEFPVGITVINGTNGAGKSTVLEAIAWAIYGTEAARGNKDSIKFNKAKARSKVRVELVFSIDREVFKVVRFLDKAELFILNHDKNDHAQPPIVISQQEVTKYLTDKIGMTKNEFFNTYFTGQKELGFLGNKDRMERRKFISKVLGYDRIRDIQEAVRTDKNSLYSEINGLKQGLENINDILEQKKLVKEELEEIKKLLTSKQKQFNAYAVEYDKIKPDWQKIRENKEKYEKATISLEFLTEKNDTLNKKTASLQEKTSSLEEKNKYLHELIGFEEEYKQTELQIKECEKLQETELLKQSLQLKKENLEKEISERTALQEEVVKSGKEKRSLVDTIPQVKSEIYSLSKQIQDIEAKKASEAKETEVLIAQKQKEIQKISGQLALIGEKGEDGACPTCERTLKGEFEKVTGSFKGQIKVLEEEITALKTKPTNIEAQNREIENLQKQKTEKEQRLSELNEVQGEYKNEQERYLRLKKEIEEKAQQKVNISLELEKLPAGFDGKILKMLKEKILPLREKYDTILVLKSEVAALDSINTELLKTLKEKTETEERKATICEKFKALNYSEKAFIELKEKFEKIGEDFHLQKNEVLKTEMEEKNKKDRLDLIDKQECLNREKLNLIKEKQQKYDLLIELERFYGSLWEKLNNQARPEISELAGKFLEDLTEGRYCELELNDKYEITLHDDGEIKPVISGGEEDIVNLSIRIAISQIIAQRSGKSLSLLVLDEIFGSLDENRRNNVMSLLRNLTNRFEQVILITHIEDIKDETDNLITIEYDPERGCSLIAL